jgi:hypothetical protein
MTFVLASCFKPQPAGIKWLGQKRVASGMARPEPTGADIEVMYRVDLTYACGLV